jgi:hypothetical protein
VHAHECKPKQWPEPTNHLVNVRDCELFQVLRLIDCADDLDIGREVAEMRQRVA